MDPIKNLAEATLASGIAADATTAPLVAGEGAELSTGAAFDVAIWNFTDYGDNHNAAKRAGKLELARVTRSTDTLTFVTRGLAPTSAIAHNTSGKVYKVRQVPTKELFDQLATKDNGTYTGTTSVQVISPDIADLGTAASGTVTLSSTKAVNKVILSGSAATIALPSSPPDGWRSLVASITGNVALTVTTPSLYRLDDPALGTVTSVSIAAATAGKAIFSFLAIGGSYVGFAVIGDDSSIPSSKLAGLSTDGTNATPSHSTFLSSQAYATHLASTLDALTLPYTDVVGLTQGAFLTRGTAGTGAAELGTFGSGLSFNPSTRVLSATATGSSTPVEISGTDIDWSAGGNFTDTIGANTTYTFSNTTDGQTIRVLITASGAYSVTWPANVYGAPSQTSTATDLYQLTRFGGIVVCSRVSANMAIDITAPTYTSTTIPTNGLTFVDTYNETLHATIATTTGRTMTVNGVSITGSSPVVSGSTVTWTASPTITVGTVTTNDYTAPSGGIKDLIGNAAVSFTGRQADVDNDSAVNTYIFAQDTESSSSSTPSGVTTSGTITFGFSATGLFTGCGSYCWRYGGNFASTKVAFGSTKSQVGIMFSFVLKEYAGVFLDLRNASNVAQASLEFRSDRINLTHGSNGYNKLTPTTPDAQAVIWILYIAQSGGGGNGILRVYYNDNSSSQTRPGLLHELTAGTGGDITQLAIFPPANSNAQYIAKLRVADNLIGDNPP